jgi:hypothetical protein
MKTSLYNQDGSLCSEAQLLLSTKPDGVSITDWRKKLKNFRSLLSAEDLKEFEKLRKKKLQSEYEISKRREVKREKLELIANIKKINLYNQDGSLHAEAQLLMSLKPDNVSKKEWIKSLKDFRNQLSPEDLKEFERLRKKKRDTKRRAENPEKVKTENVKWRAKNPEKLKQDGVKWRAENPEKVKQDNAKWRAENSGYSSNYHKQRKLEDPLFRLLCNMRSACSRVVKQLSLGKKPMSTFKWIGCSPEELKARLESLFTEGMTWQNYGEWHVDHIRPICSFTTEEWEQVNHYNNLRPLWAEDNLAKIVFDKRQTVNKKTPQAL